METQTQNKGFKTYNINELLKMEFHKYVFLDKKYVYIYFKGKYEKKLSKNHLKTFTECDGYAFDYKRINDPKKLINWIYHLVGKNWCNNDMINDLILEIQDRYRKENDQDIMNWDC